MGWKTYDPELWERTRAGVLSRREGSSAPVFGSDSDPGAVEISRSNIRRAKLENSVSLTRALFEDAAPPPEGSGTIILNPPYGKRMKNEDISALYTRIGDTLKRKYRGWTAWIFSSNLEAIKHIGLRPFRRIPLKNGPLECRLVGFQLF
jgi:putative N6-adenine-specific DNA methylase